MPRARRCHFPRGVVLLLWSVRHLSQLCRCRLLGGPECLLCRRRQSGRLGRAHTLHQWTDPVPASAPTFGAAPRVRPYFVQRANFAVRSCQDARLRPSFRSAQDYAVYPSETLTLQSPEQSGPAPDRYFRPMNASFQDWLILCNMGVQRSFLRGRLYRQV